MPTRSLNFRRTSSSLKKWKPRLFCWLISVPGDSWLIYVKPGDVSLHLVSSKGEFVNRWSGVSVDKSAV